MKIGYPPTSELLRLRVLAATNGHAENRENVAQRLLAIEHRLRREASDERKRGEKNG